MKKLFIISMVCFALLAANAQNSISENTKKGNLTGSFLKFVPKADMLFDGTVTLMPKAADLPCADEVGYYYKEEIGGAIAGSNVYDDQKFGYVYKGVEGSVTKVIADIAKMKDGTVANIQAELFAVGANGLPTTLLGTSKPISTKDISEDGDWYEFVFDPQVVVPANFAAVVTVTEYTPTSTHIAISTSEMGCIVPEYADRNVSFGRDGWEIMYEAWEMTPEEWMDMMIGVVIEPASDINSHTKATCTIAPNPANHAITVSSQSNILTIDIYNLVGQLVYSAKVNSPQATVYVTDFAEGLYIAKITTPEGVSEKKFSVNK